MKIGGTKLFAVGVTVLQTIYNLFNCGADAMAMDVLFPESASMEDFFFQHMYANCYVFS